MEIRIIKAIAGPNVHFKPNQIVDIDSRKALKWIAAGFAESIESPDSGTPNRIEEPIEEPIEKPIQNETKVKRERKKKTS